MRVIYLGHEKVLMTDYNGKRYCFEKGISKDVPDEVYNSIILSGHIGAMELRPITEEAPKETPKEERKPEPKEEKRGRGRPRR